MNTLTLFVAAAFIGSSAAAQPLEALRLSAESALFEAAPLALHPDLIKTQEPILQVPLRTRLLLPPESVGTVIARMSLPTILNNSRHILTRTLGARVLDLGVVSDAAFSSYFLTFTDGNNTTLAALGDLNHLRGAGVDVYIDGKTAYNFKISINIFNPVYGSTLKMTPIAGTQGPRHNVGTGTLLDAIHSRSLAFKAHGQELYMLYSTDALPDASGFAATRSFLFIKEDGLSSKAWPLAEAKLPLDSSAAVDLDGLKFNLTRTAGGELIIRE